MKALLVYPEFPDTFWSFKHALKFVRKRAALPPLGLLTVAAMLPPEWSKRLVDANARPLTKKDLAWADCVFISAMVVQRESARLIIAQCKEAGKRVIAGGPLFQIEHEQFGAVDHFILNEAEVTLGAFLRDFSENRAGRVYASDRFADLRQSPGPMWELLDFRHYVCLSIQFSRGCPFSCDFCNITALLGHRVRMKSAAQIISELDSMYALGWRGDVFFVDDNFIGNRQFLKTDLLPAIIRWRRGKKGMVFNTEASLNLVEDPELMNMMVEAGFSKVFIGIETPDENCLAECGKAQNRNRNIVEDVKRIQRSGLQVQGGFIVGFDSDRPTVFRRQIDFIQKSGIVTAMVGLLQAPPGTRLYERMKQEGRLLGTATGDNADGTTNIIPAMSIETLREGYREILRHIYSPEHYYQRIRTFLREYKPPKFRTPLQLSSVFALFSSIYRLGILGQERMHYWKLLFWTQFRRPKLFPEAITLAIYGYHFRNILKRHRP